MALVCVQCKMLYVIFLLISLLSIVSCTTDTYQYDTDLTNNVDTQFFLLPDENFHLLQKRDLNSDVKKQNLTTIHSTSIQATQKPTENPLVKLNDTLHLNTNLGVNGTGIRKNITKDNNVVQNVTEQAPVAINTTLTPLHDPVPNVTLTIKSNQTNGDDDLALSNYSEDLDNKTMTENNATKTEYDTHQYYNSTFTVDPAVREKFWVNMTNMTNVKVNELLSQSHRRAVTVKLSFDFPFYGHIVRNVTIATGGFLYTGEYVHSWLAATQYIAPLMANFDTSLANHSYIKYVDNGTSFTVQWERVALQDKPQDGEFTFQATLHNNGDIVFVYEHIPIRIDLIQDDHHSVKVGLSDAYIIDRTIFFVRRKTIYEYHRVNFHREDIKNWTVIYLSALPTCLINKDCNSCLTKPTSNFQCTWCPSSNRCSTGTDRYRQDWLTKNCERRQIKNESQCSTADLNGDSPTSDGASSHYDTDVNHEHRQLVDDPKQASRMTNEVNIRHTDKPPSVGISGIVTILFIFGFMGGLGMWVLYAYRNPHSASGQILIKYRLSQWSWRRGEARYTAATVHM